MAADVNARGKIAQFHRSSRREIRLLGFLAESEPRRRRDPEEEKTPRRESGEINGAGVRNAR